MIIRQFVNAPFHSIYIFTFETISAIYIFFFFICSTVLFGSFEPLSPPPPRILPSRNSVRLLLTCDIAIKFIAVDLRLAIRWQNRMGRTSAVALHTTSLKKNEKKKMLKTSVALTMPHFDAYVPVCAHFI